MEIRGLSSDKSWDYENAYYWFSPYNRIAKQISQWEIFKETIKIPGDILELGVLKGASLIRWATFREILENSHSRKIIGFDAFGEFPIHKNADEDDRKFISDHDEYAGNGLGIDTLTKVLGNKGFENIELKKGDIFDTIPKYLEKNPHTKISLLHLDMDTYHPTAFALDKLWNRVSSGGVVVIDDYNSIAGATNAVDEFIVKRNLKIQLKKASYYSVPSYIVKP